MGKHIWRLECQQYPMCWPLVSAGVKLTASVLGTACVTYSVVSLSVFRVRGVSQPWPVVLKGADLLSQAAGFS